MRHYCTCFTCGARFPRRPSDIRDRNYCSIPCKYPPSPFCINDDGTASLPLRAQNGSVRALVIVDLGDAEWASQWRWSLAQGYAKRHTRTGSKRRWPVLHRELLRLTYGDPREGDHIDRNPLNCRRSNLRALPPGKNRQNQSSHERSTSTYRGVSWDNNRSKWMACVKVHGATVHLGRFDSEVEAGAAAATARLQLLPYAVD